MEKQLFKDVAPGERQKYLRDNAFVVKDKYTYTRELDPAEMDERKDNLSQNYINIDRADQELNKAKEIHKAIASPLKQDNAALLKEIRTRSEEITGPVYLMRDDDNAENVGIYSPEGTLIMVRGILPEERQYGIQEAISINRAL